MIRLATVMTVLLIVAASSELTPCSATSSELSSVTDDSHPVTDSVRHDDWRRTALGWERSSRWRHGATPIVRASYDDFVHPAAIACLQALLSIGALVAARES